MNLPVVIFAGGFGTRLTEETELKPKPLITLGGIPIIEHVMNIYAQQGCDEFILLLGYKSEEIKEWFLKRARTAFDFQLNMSNSTIIPLTKSSFDWKITFLDTGLHTNTAGRLSRLADVVSGNDFYLTYADGLGNINLQSLFEHHKKSKKMVTMTTTKAKDKFGVARLDNNEVVEFNEKPEYLESNIRVNSGFFVVSTDILSNFNFQETESWESGVLEKLAKISQLNSYPHDEFWHSMDTLRDKRELESLMQEQPLPWLSLE